MTITEEDLLALLQALGQHLLPELETMTADSLLDRFIGRSRELGVALYPDDSFNLRDAAQWQECCIPGRW